MSAKSKPHIRAGCGFLAPLFDQDFLPSLPPGVVSFPFFNFVQPCSFCLLVSLAKRLITLHLMCYFT